MTAIADAIREVWQLAEQSNKKHAEQQETAKHIERNAASLQLRKSKTEMPEWYFTATGLERTIRMQEWQQQQRAKEAIKAPAPTRPAQRMTTGQPLTASDRYGRTGLLTRSATVKPAWTACSRCGNRGDYIANGIRYCGQCAPWSRGHA